jgi:hypothetical protein
MFALAVGLLWAGTAMSASEMRFSDIEARLSAVEQRTAAIRGLTPAAFLSDDEAIDAIAPNDAVTEDGDEEIVSPYPSTSTSTSTQSCDSCNCGECGCCETCNGDSCECGSACGGRHMRGFGGAVGRGMFNDGSYYADVELMFLRAHVTEFSAGKLSEKYELSPRFVIGYETARGVGARLRYWTYGRTSNILNDAAEVRYEFSAFDIEATSRFQTCRSELVVAGGLRFASAEVDWDGESVDADLPGVTVAADLRTLFCSKCGREWAGVAGARWSILGGDWEGSDDALITPIRDDNVVVQELYFGVEYSQHFRDCVFFSRLVLEMQNWHSDAAAQSAGADSIGFVGPGIHIGGAF